MTAIGIRFNMAIMYQSYAVFIENCTAFFGLLMYNIKRNMADNNSPENKTEQ
jgi:hypothetical protein